MDSSRAAQASLSDRRFFVAELVGAGQELTLSSEAAKHAQVLRLLAGDEIELFDGLGHTILARILSVSRGSLVCERVGALQTARRERDVVLVQCVPKGTKLDDIVRMTTELGVSEIRLAISERCVSRVDEERGASKGERLSRIAIEAARQSEQAFVPKVWPAKSLAAVLAEAPVGATKLVCLERGEAAFAELGVDGAVWVTVGPEGGFSPNDVALLSAAGFQATGLGRSILRTETAAVVGVALVLDRLRQRR